MIEMHFMQIGGYWWAYSKNDYDVVTHVARGRSQFKARAKLLSQFNDIDVVAKAVSEANRSLKEA